MSNNIGGINSVNTNNYSVPSKAPQQGPAIDKKPVASIEDTGEITKAIKQMVSEGEPPMNKEKVAEIKAQYDSGNYQIDYKALATEVLREYNG